MVGIWADVAAGGLTPLDPLLTPVLDGATWIIDGQVVERSGLIIGGSALGIVTERPSSMSSYIAGGRWLAGSTIRVSVLATVGADAEGAPDFRNEPTSTAGFPAGAISLALAANQSRQAYYSQAYHRSLWIDEPEYPFIDMSSLFNTPYSERLLGTFWYSSDAEIDWAFTVNDNLESFASFTLQGRLGPGTGVVSMVLPQGVGQPGDLRAVDSVGFRWTAVARGDGNVLAHATISDLQIIPSPGPVVIGLIALAQVGGRRRSPGR